jgi:hypothetical protein
MKGEIIAGGEGVPEVSICRSGIVSASRLAAGWVATGSRPMEIEVAVIRQGLGNRQRHVLGRDLDPSLDQGNVGRRDPCEPGELGTGQLPSLSAIPDALVDGQLLLKLPESCVERLPLVLHPGSPLFTLESSRRLDKA